MRLLGPFVRVCVVLVAMRGAARANDWPQLGYDGSRARASEEISGAPFRAMWRVPISTRAIVATPAVADGIVVIAGSDGQIRGMRADDGTQLWRHDAGAEVTASPAVLRGQAFVPTLGGHLIAVRIADGGLIWDRSIGGQNHGSPTLVGDSLVVAASFPIQKIMRLSSANGALLWETKPGVVGGLVHSSPAVDDQRVIFGMNDGRYRSLDLATGAASWTVQTAGLVNLSGPVLAGDTAYLVPGGHSAAVYAVDRDSGAIRPGWPVTVQDPAAPTAGVVTVRHSVSSPALAGRLMVLQMRFEYTLSGADGSHEVSYLTHEYVVAIDRRAAAVAWHHALAARSSDDPKLLPGLGLCPTPAVYAADGGPQLAAASSVVPALRVLDARSGRVLWETPTSAPSRSSPVVANAQLLVGSENGYLQAFSSDVNHPPPPPSAGFVPGGASTLDGSSGGTSTLRWSPAKDPEGSPVAYQVRVDTDGEILETWLAELSTKPGEATVRLPPGLLRAGSSYGYAVRSRDPEGALSAWSPLQTFRAAPATWIAVGGKSYEALGDAIAAAPPGATVTIGQGTVRLAVPVQVPAGVRLVGQGPQRTILDGQGLRSVLEIGPRAARGTGSAGPTEVRGLTVAGALVGIRVGRSGSGVLRNLIVRDNARAGIDVEDGGSAHAINTTLTGNGAGAEAAGTLAVRNSIITGNQVGLSRRGPGPLTSRYNDLYDNRTADYEGVEPGLGDISAPVMFAGPDRNDYRLTLAQATTDKGDPADTCALEPPPNGGRVNMGAFGNTPAAVVSASGADGADGKDAPNLPTEGHSFDEKAALPIGFSLLAALLSAGYLAFRRWRRARLLRGSDRVQWVMFR